MWRVLPLVLDAACAGQTTVDSCTPNVCGCDFETCEDLAVVPGDTVEVIATFLAEGSHSGTFTFTASAEGPGSVTIQPGSADVDGTIDLTLTLLVDADAVGGDSISVSFEGNRDKGDLGAGEVFFADVQTP